jgi:predicted DNA-binding transcriptional regulator AlpA
VYRRQSWQGKLAVRHERLPDVARIETAPRRGLARPEAARYVGVSPGNFNAMVSDGRMPQPKRIGRRLVWDIRALDVAFDELPDRDDSSSNADGTWDDFQ